MTKKLIHSKTFWAGLATICAGIGSFVAGEHQLQEFVMIIVGAIFIMLRTVTNTGIEMAE